MPRTRVKMTNASSGQTFSRAILPVNLGEHKSEPQRFRLFLRPENDDGPHTHTRYGRGPPAASRAVSAEKLTVGEKAAPSPRLTAANRAHESHAGR